MGKAKITPEMAHQKFLIRNVKRAKKPKRIHMFKEDTTKRAAAASKRRAMAGFDAEIKTAGKKAKTSDGATTATGLKQKLSSKKAALKERESKEKVVPGKGNKAFKSKKRYKRH